MIHDIHTRLSDVPSGKKCVIIKINGHGGLRKNLIKNGFVKGVVVEVILNKQLTNLMSFRINAKEISLRRSEAAFVQVLEFEIVKQYLREDDQTLRDEHIRRLALDRSKHIHITWIGQKQKPEANFSYQSYIFHTVAMPSVYGLPLTDAILQTVEDESMHAFPDVIIQQIDACKLKEQLMYTTHLIDMNIRVVIALYNHETLTKNESRLSIDWLSRLLGLPIVAVNIETNQGMDDLWEVVSKLYEGSDILDKEGNLLPFLQDDELLDEHYHQINLSHRHRKQAGRAKKSGLFSPSDLEDNINLHTIIRHIHIYYGAGIERGIEKLKTVLMKNESARDEFAPRYLAVKLLEHNKQIENFVIQFPNYQDIIKVRDAAVKEIENDLLDDASNAIDGARKGFIQGALKETFHSSAKPKEISFQDKLDHMFTHKVWGYFVFVMAIFITFQATFLLGAYPMEWIETLVNWAGNGLDATMQNGMLKDLLVDGIIGGVGGVLVFLPNILILYFFLTFMETSGYMARAAFIMDAVMHRIGLHGRSFIPLIMGFGCNVPAIMATRSIRNPNSRMITILINPLMSCSARLPIYLLLAGAFFPAHAGWVLFSIYFFGIILAAILALIFKRFLFSKDEVPAVMELPPYRIPGVKSILRDTWDKAYQYLKKIGTVILLGSIIIWALSFFPRHEQTIAGHELTAEMKIEQQENSYLGHIGKFISPALEPLGFDWKISIALLTGVASKEIVVSTLGVLYNADVASGDHSLTERLRSEKRPDGTPAFTSAIALSLMLFVLIYFPCIATIATIKHETGSWRWALFAVFYTIVLAWMVSFAVYQSIAHHAVQEVAVVLILFISIVISIHYFRKSLKRKHGCQGCTACDSLQKHMNPRDCRIKERKIQNKL